MFFSIIVPVYNVQSYINECVDSILNQSFNEFELILIDDGSFDESSIICDKYAKKDDRVIVIHKENGGLSSARNTGLSIARGEYIIFVDSDDWILEDSLLCLKHAIEKSNFPDLLETTLIEKYEESMINEDDITSFFEKNSVNKETVFSWMFYESKIVWPAPKTIIKNSYIRSNGFLFADGRLHEDLDWTARITYYANSFGICGKPWYCHRMNRPGSITSSIGVKNIIDIFEMSMDFETIYVNNKDQYSYIIINRIIASLCSAIYSFSNNMNDFSQFDVALVIKYIEKNKRIFRYSESKKYKLFYCSTLLFGAKKTLHLLHCMGSVKINVKRLLHC